MEPTEPALPLLSFAEIVSGDLTGMAPDLAQGLRALTHWTRTFLMSTHPDLGRTGDVCPFTAQGARLDTLRYGVSLAAGHDLARIRREMADAFDAFDRVPHPRRMGHFRAVMVAFPNCADPKGLETLAAVQKSLRLKSLRTDRMVGLFHDGTEAEGLWNAAFRPLRSPIPLLAIRALVENDAAFAARHPMLVPTYLKRFKLAGGRKLMAHFLRRA